MNNKTEMETDKEQAFEAMLGAHGDTITKLCFFYADTPDEVADMRQDVLLNLWRGWESYRAEAALGTWVYRVTLNTCVSYTRRERRHRGHSELSEIHAVADDGDDRSVLWREMHDRISQLSTRDRAVILLWLEDFSYDEIADVMGAKRNTVAAQIHRIKQKLANTDEK